MTYVKTLEQVAEEIGKSLGTVMSYKRKGAPLQKTKRGYAVEPLRDWIAGNVRRRVDVRSGASPKDGNGAGENAETIEDARRRLTIAQADKAEADVELRKVRTELDGIKLAISRGEYVPIERVKERDRERIAAVKSGLFAMVRRMAYEVHGLPAKKIEQKLKKAATELCERFAGVKS